MKRDMDLIRAIAFKIEEATEAINSEEIQIEGYTDKQIGYHCEIMHEGGLIDAMSVATMDSQFAELRIKRLTWEGHDFADAARSDTIWNKVNGAVKTGAASVTFETFKELLKTAAGHAVNLGIAASQGYLAAT